MRGKEIRFGHGLVSPGRVERPAAPPTRPGSLGNELLGVRWVLVCRRVHALCIQGCGGGAPSQFRNFHGEGGSLRPLMSARKMCICSHKNGKGILTYYRGGVLVGDGNRVGDLLPATHAGSVAPPRLQGARVWLWYCGLFGTDFRFSHCHALPSSPIRRWGVQRVVNAGA